MLNASRQSNREKHGVKDQPEPKRILPIQPSVMTAEQKQKLERRREVEAARAADVEVGRRERLVESVQAAIGKRYSDCTFGNYQSTTKDQIKVVSRMAEYADALNSGNRPVSSIVLFGPVGTGKDHLLSVLMLTAARNGHSVYHMTGVDIYAKCRDTIDSDRSEAQLLDEFTAPDVLCISDPIPPWGELTAPQVSFMFRAIDRRYRDNKPTWVSMNSSNSKEATKRMSAQLVDRLKDGAICLACNWKSYRKEQQS